MKKREADITRHIALLIRSRFTAPAVFEIKYARGGSLPFAALKEHQSHALSAANKGGFTYKIPDSGSGFKPFDLVFFGNMPAYVVVAFSQSEIYFITHSRWRQEEVFSNRKSLTKKRAKEIADVVIGDSSADSSLR